MSPARTPAFPAGPYLLTRITMSPRPCPPSAVMASGNATGWSAKPSQPGSTRPAVKSGVRTRSMVAAGIPTRGARARRGHPQKASRCIENRSPFFYARDRQVERYTVIDPATTQAMPSRAKSANDAHPHDRPAAVGSEHQGERREARLDCSWEIDFDGLLEPERDNICAAITAGDARLRHPSVRQHDLGLLGFGHDLLRSDRNIGAPERSAPWLKLGAADANDEPLSDCRARHECIRQLSQSV